ncbi:hypothetical protein [Fulvivirga lutimaris]|uniref:hypothetical protein n=1 Tax=Fulvivirga lutimaris TaxID=1819566 RepID=UPI0012BCC673|nr:hypothetical protein [Fulvivirga lutimaris]MTI38789.1 hypothetical protein [Fulvivirga lutimaris]
MRKYLLMAMVSTIAISFSNAQYNSFDKISMSMEAKTAKDGYVSSINAIIYYNNDGKMVTYYSHPKEYILLNNIKGEIKIYDAKENTVLQQQNYRYSTETSQFYFFLNNKQSDLGLKQMGFIQSNISFEEDVMVTEWLPPAEMAQAITKVELVHENGVPIYIAYYDANNQLSTKSYYYNYNELYPGLSFPATITKISYISPTDSTITKTSFNNILIDEKVDTKAINFKIPDNAKSIN